MAGISARRGRRLAIAILVLDALAILAALIAFFYAWSEAASGPWFPGM